ncbi:MAG: GGDEF domain-containing protein [Acholeplasmataceae bacterium]
MPKKYDNYTKEALIKALESTEERLEEEMKFNNEEFLIQFPWAGNLGQWTWHVDTNKVIFNEKKATQIGYDPKTIGDVGFEFFTSKLHLEDYEPVMDNMRKHMMGESQAYEVEYRIRHKEGHYLWYYDRGTVTKRDKDGSPLLIQGIVFDITESKRVEERLRDLSEKDDLTSIYNRRTFYIKVDELIEANHQQDIPFSLVMFDIDHFKKVNDTYGHLVGDDVLKRLTKMILEDKRYEDQVFRFGGEEFFLLLPNTNLKGAVQLAERLHKLIQKMKIPKVNHITVSMGVVAYVKHEGVDAMIKRVDDLMYEAKVSGRNQIKHQKR